MNASVWVLQVKQMDYPTDRAEDDRNSKFLSEIYLTRLLKTKVSFTFLWFFRSFHRNV